MLKVSEDSLSQKLGDKLHGTIAKAITLARTLLPQIPSEITVEFEDRTENSGVGVSGYPARREPSCWRGMRASRTSGRNW